MNKMINENSVLKYRVILDGQTLTESLSTQLAEQFISTLLPEQRSRARIETITESGQTVLFG